MCKKICLILVVTFALSLLLLSQENIAGEKIEEDVYKIDRMGLSVRLPEGEWYAKDSSQGVAWVFTLTNRKWSGFSLVLVMMPSAIGIRSAEDRNLQLSNYFGDKYEKVGIEKGRIDGRETGVLIYNYKDKAVNQRSLTHVFVVDDQTCLLQVSLPDQYWEKGEKMIAEIFAGIALFERTTAAVQDERPVDTEKEESGLDKIETKARILHHSLDLDIDPGTGRFEVTDKIDAEISENDVTQVEFQLSDMEVDSVTMGGNRLEHSLEPLQEYSKKMVIDLDKTYSKGDKIVLEYTAHKDDFLFTNPGKLIADYNIFGQVREDSSYTSHVFYYPFDEDNATSGDVWITVPKGYQAISVGKLVEVKAEGEKSLFHWKTDFALPRMLPFAFAVAKYEKYTAESASGVTIEVYTWKAFEKQALERVDVIKDIVDFESKLYGKFPFEKIAFIHVVPKEGLAGVSLPTMILLSDMFFKSDVSYDVIKESVQRAMTGPLVLADEMSHQWNAYAVFFPNQLAEGMAQYTDTLFAEHIGGKDVLKKHMDYYLGLYKAAVAIHPDKLIASQEIYQTEAYSSIAFCKGALVLNMLRYVVGDDMFFEAFRNMFETNFGKKADFDTLREGMEAKYGRPLDWFFEQWYHRTGYPRYEMTLGQTEKQGDVYTVKVFIKQTQKGGFFKMPMDITFVSGDAEKTFDRVLVDEREKSLTFELDFDPQKVLLDKDMWLLEEVVYK
ncbi:MAG: hypothetical protein JXB23_14990 [Candidatus Aminicenantes bacterium]|nr:hypothetical protein [Candidatus Aminicenantes bacterium]